MEHTLYLNWLTVLLTIPSFLSLYHKTMYLYITLEFYNRMLNDLFVK